MFLWLCNPNKLEKFVANRDAMGLSAITDMIPRVSEEVLHLWAPYSSLLFRWTFGAVQRLNTSWLCKVIIWIKLMIIASVLLIHWTLKMDTLKEDWKDSREWHKQEPLLLAPSLIILIASLSIYISGGILSLSCVNGREKVYIRDLNGLKALTKSERLLSLHSCSRKPHPWEFSVTTCLRVILVTENIERNMRRCIWYTTAIDLTEWWQFEKSSMEIPKEKHTAWLFLIYFLMLL